MTRREERVLLDTVRWISALMVGLGHALGLVFRRDGSLPSHIVWYLADMRGAWVMLFFVLSGYLVGGNFAVRQSNFDPGQYFIARFSRIYIVLLPALALTLALDGGAHIWAADNAVYSHPWPNGVLGDTSVFSRYNWQSAVASVFSIEPFIGTGIGSNGVLWSLGYEWVFYFVFPVVVLAAGFVAGRLRLPKSATACALVIATAVLLVVIHQGWGALFWLVWTSGALAHVLVETGRVPVWLRWSGAVLCVGGLLAAPFVNAKLSIVMIGFGFAAFLSLFPKAERGIDGRADKLLAGFSYSFYVVHLPILAFLTLVFVKAGLIVPGGVAVGVVGWACLAVMMTAAVAVAYVFGRLFEDNTDRVRRRLRALQPRLAAARRPSS